MKYVLISILLLPGVGNCSETGLASWYGPGFHGKKMANGKTYDMYAVSCAHKSLPLGSYVKVIAVQGGNSIIAQVTDRGPYKPGRVVDLSLGAAKQLGIVGKGIESVKVCKLI